MRLSIILKSLFIGSTMTIPGVSGGTMAIIIGIYEDLLKSINGLKYNIKKHLPFLIQFILGAGFGFILFARFVTLLLNNPFTGSFLKFFFSGIVLGGIPLLVKKSNLEKLSISNILVIISGSAIVILLSRLPAGLFSSGTGPAYILLQFLGGFIIAIALILPGISASHMLYVLGLYNEVLKKAYSFQWLSLIPLVLGLFVGTFITTGILENLLKKYTTKVYLTIIGFVAASIISLLPSPPISNPIICFLFSLVGFTLMYATSSYRR